MNKVCKSVFSKRVLDTMTPACKLVRQHVLDVDFNSIRYHTPKGKNAEMIKLLRWFVVVPNAGWLIDRVCTFEKEKVQEDEESQYLCVKLLNKSKDFFEKRFNDGVEYLLGGILPMVYKYVTAFYNLINYKDKDEVLDGLKKMQELLETFIDNNDLFCTYASTEKMIKTPDMFIWGRMNDDVSVSMSQSRQKSKIQLAEEMRLYCEDIIDNIEIYYIGWPHYLELIKQYKEVTHEEFLKG